MIKNNKKGFTLAELLIVIGIISIISAMGLTISKKGVERAYDYYVYNSYKSLSLAIGDAISNGCSLDTLLDKNEDGIYKNLKNFYEYISKAFNLTAAPEDDGIKYSFNTAENVRYSLNAENSDYIHIVITIPDPNKRKSLDYLFYINYPEYGLVPASHSDRENKLIVIDRIDLLPFTINDDTTGKIANRAQLDQDGNITSYKPTFLEESKKFRQKYSYYNVFCELYDSLDENVINIITKQSGSAKKIKFGINCPNGNKESGAIKLLDPKKAF